MRTTNALRTRFRKAEVFDLSFLNELLDHSRNVFDRNFRIDTMLIEEVDGIALSLAIAGERYDMPFRTSRTAAISSEAAHVFSR